MSKTKKTLPKPNLTAIDLFCGCGGLTLGLKMAGFKILGAVDIDSSSVATYKANHPEVRVWEKDIRKLKPGTLKRTFGIKKGELGLLAGCPPCQGFSCMRTLNGAREIEDPCNDLLNEFQMFAEVFRPKAVMLENVPGLATDKRFTSFLNHMKEIGYVGKARILDAADYGVPQRRRRLIYIAALGTEIQFAKKTKKRLSVRKAIAHLPKTGKSSDPLHNMPEHRTAKVMEFIKRIPKNGGSRTDLPIEDQLECHKNCSGFKDVYGRMAWDEVAPTITSGCFNPSKGRFLHPEEDRAITMREASLLQGFPRRYQFPVTSKITIALMIGNALPPPFIASHAKSICKYLLATRL